VKTRSNRCGACVLRGDDAAGSPGPLHCKSFRLCDVFDVSMIQFAPGQTVAQYIGLHQEVALASSTVQEILRPVVSQIDMEDDFVEMVLLTHRSIFLRAFPGFAGRFRASGEDVEVGHNAHAFDGAPPDEIGRRVRELGRSLHLERDPTRIASFADWAARLTRDFLAIHPFVDGNGRTVRAIVEATASHVGLHVKWPDFRTRRDRRRDRDRYLSALQYAHMCLGLTKASRHSGQQGAAQPYAPLASWWARRIVGSDDFVFGAEEADVPAEEWDVHRSDIEDSKERTTREAETNLARAEWLSQPMVFDAILPRPKRSRRRA